jgi:glyoxylase-like metal-dependent hydrolase (beta-lactamase superfamily II)
LFIGETARLDAGDDMQFVPDHRIADGDAIAGDGWDLEAIATPGHTANHMAFALRGTDVLFSGDHVMGWSTSIVAPPDGSMSDYMTSLHRLAVRPERVYLPGHGDAIRDAPGFVVRYIEHRRGREASILHRLGKGETDITNLVRAIYIGLDPRLTGAAALSTLAHLEDLTARGLVKTDGAPSISGRYRLPP